MPMPALASAGARVLEILQEAPATAREVAAVTGTSAQAAHRTLLALHGLGLVQRSAVRNPLFTHRENKRGSKRVYRYRIVAALGDLYAVRCPTCGADPGGTCWSGTEPIRWPHPGRVSAGVRARQQASAQSGS